MSVSLDDTDDLFECFDSFEPRAEVHPLNWCIENVTSVKERPYDHSAFPHIGAPGGPMDAFADHRVRNISLQWASRLGKTFFAQCMLMYTADVDPAPMMVASSQESLAIGVMKRNYAMIRKIPQLFKQLPTVPNQSHIVFNQCEVFAAWAKSTSTLADKDIKIGHANEIDKWEYRSTSTEGHPIKLFTDRGKDFNSTKKFMFESTPSIKGKSNIEKLRLQGTNCRYQVPCPHCSEFQELELKRIKWDKPASGKDDLRLARNTARYICRHCECEIKDNHRKAIMNRGVWCPEGCTVKAKEAMNAHARELYSGETDIDFVDWHSCEWVEGEPVGNIENASYQLSSLYALSLSWGAIASEFISSKGNKKDLQNFVNQWLGETWEVIEQRQTWEELGQRIITARERGVVPNEAAYLTFGIDKQNEFYVYTALAWSEDQTSDVIDYGTLEDSEAVKEFLRGEWFYEDGSTIKPSMVLIDSGFRPKDVHTLVKSLKKEKIPCYACRGVTAPLSAWYEKKKNQKKSANPGIVTVRVDNSHTEDWVDERLYALTPAEPGGLGVYQAPIGEHQDFLEQILNMHLNARLDNHKNVKEVWERIDENTPNDYRDCLRYALIALMLILRGKKVPARLKQENKVLKQKPEDDQTSFVRKPARKRFVRRAGE